MSPLPDPPLANEISSLERRPARYTVNCDGTGVVTRILTVGTTQTEQFDDFVITHAIVEDGHLIATSVTDAQRTPSTIVAGGIFLTRVWTRIPSHGGHPWDGR